MSRYALLLSVLCSAVAVLVVLGCGSSDKGSSSTVANTAAGTNYANAAANADDGKTAKDVGWTGDAFTPYVNKKLECSDDENVPADGVMVNNKTCCVAGKAITDPKYVFAFNGWLISKCCPGCQEAFTSSKEKMQECVARLKAETGIDVMKPAPKGGDSGSGWTNK